jgi:hypothetical protein
VWVLPGYIKVFLTVSLVIVQFQCHSAVRFVGPSNDPVTVSFDGFAQGAIPVIKAARKRFSSTFGLMEQAYHALSIEVGRIINPA